MFLSIRRIMEGGARNTLRFERSHRKPHVQGCHSLSVLSSVKLKYIRLTYSSRDPLNTAPIYFAIVDTLLILDNVDLKTYTCVHRDSTDAPHTCNIGVRDPKWLQWWEPAEENISKAGERDQFFTMLFGLSPKQVRKASENQT